MINSLIHVQATNTTFSVVMRLVVSLYTMLRIIIMLSAWEHQNLTHFSLIPILH